MPLVTRHLRTPIIDVKENWDDDWRPMTTAEFGNITDAEPVDCVFASASHDMSSATVRCRYGNVQQPGETQPTYRVAATFLNWWMRIRYNYGTDSSPEIKTLFVGRIEDEVRDVFGFSSVPTGNINYTAFGAEQVLQRISVDRSVWTPDGSGAARVVDWLAPMNMTDERNALVGNRSSEPVGDHYVFGEDGELWSALTFGEYLVSEFLNSDNPRDPQWAIIGSADTIDDLSNLKEPIEFGEVDTLASMFHTIFPREKGFDWYVYPLESGGMITFVIYVFSLTSEDIQFGTRTLHANPNTVSYTFANNLDLITAQFQEASSQWFKRIRVKGQRILVCGTFTRGTTLTDIEDGWPNALETAYESGTGDDTDPSELHDDYRATDQFAAVYQRFYAAANLTALDDAFFPRTDDNGNAVFDDRVEPLEYTGRETLSWLPLKESVDYSEDPAVDSNDAFANPAFLPPQAYLQRLDPAVDSPYVSAERVGVHVSALPFDWGVQLSCSPNHLIADQYFTETNASDTAPEYSYKYLKMTIAWRSHAAFEMRHTFNDAVDVANVDGELVVSVPQAEMWVLAPSTVVGLDEAGDPITSPAYGIVLRSDNELLEQALAGAIARYQRNRNRATIRVKGIWDWGVSVGTFLQTDEIDSPITYVRWSFDGDHETELKTGFSL